MLFRNNGNVQDGKKTKKALGELDILHADPKTEAQMNEKSLSLFEGETSNSYHNITALRKRWNNSSSISNAICSTTSHTLLNANVAGLAPIRSPTVFDLESTAIKANRKNCVVQIAK